MKKCLLSQLGAVAVWSLTSVGSADAATAVVTDPSVTSIGIVTGGDEGEGLDLTGNFLYALSIGANIGDEFPIRDATFLGLIDAEVPGATLVAGNRILNWKNVNYGDSEDDDTLERATSSIRWSAAGSAIPAVILTLEGLTPGSQYQLQLIFGEECCNRGFDVFIDDNLIVKDFNPGNEQGGINNDFQEALITHSYLATGTTLVLRLDGAGASADYGDHNAIFNAITVEEVGAAGDVDGDGLPDPWELSNFGDLSATAAGDPDGDGLTNAEELAAGTNPKLADTDNDGLNDSLEVKTYHTSPFRADTDGDGLTDKDEVTIHNTDPLKADTDGDLISDGAEVVKYKTDPLKTDTDGDGSSDYAEIHLLTDPLVAASKPQRTTANVFTGPDEGQGLDLLGNFPYAVGFGIGPEGGQVFDAFFTSDSVEGVVVDAAHGQNTWNVGVNFGDSAEQQGLSTVLKSIRWSEFGGAVIPHEVTVTFSNLEVGGAYKLQLLFGEYLWARGFNIYIAGHLAAKEFAPFQWQGGFTGLGAPTARDNGVVLTRTFIANGTELIIVLDGRPVTDPTMADHNPIINGATLELVEPPADTDGDGLWDAWERDYFGNLDQRADGDPDGDGLTNVEEYNSSTDPTQADSDADGLKDGAEVNTSHTDPLNADTDGDGLSDGAEVNTYHSDPSNTDTDGDGLTDGAEANTHKTDPTKSDTDGDQQSDGLEIALGSDPLTADPVTVVSNVIVQAISGGDPGEGLDLEGNFLYAFNVSSAGAAGLAGDADFTADNAPGIKVTAPNNIPAWDLPEYGDTPADDVIEKVMQSIRYGPTVKVELAGLVPGSTYRLQLLFYEQCCGNRGFNVYADGQLVAADFSPPGIQGGINLTSSGALVSADLVASRDKLVIHVTTYGRTDPTFTDGNAILDGVTLEVLNLVAPPTLTLTPAANGQITIATDGTLQSASLVEGPYTSLPNNSITIDPKAGASQQFYRGTR